jgi:hypothetical protein
MIQMKAKKFACLMNTEDFEASAGRLFSFESATAYVGRLCMVMK